MWNAFFKMLQKSELPWGWLILTLAVMFGYSRVYLMFPDFTEQVINGDLSGRIIASFILVILGTMVLNALQGFISGLTNAKIEKGMQNTAWKAITNLPVSRIDQENGKELISRVTTDTNSVSMALSSHIPSLLQQIYMVTGTIIAVGNQEPSMRAALILLLVLQLVTTMIAGRFTFRFNSKAQKKMAEMTELIAEVMANISVVKIFSSEERESSRGIRSIRASYYASMTAQNVSNAAFYLARLVNQIGMLAVIILGGYLVSQGRIEIGAWIAYFMYYQMMTYSVQMIPYYWKEIKACQGKLHRLSLIISSPPEDLEGGEGVAPCNGDFAFENVSFSYGQKRVLDDVSFTVPAGSLVAIAGENGAGKTTALNLLERFYQPASGKITYAGKDAAGLKLSDWRNLFSYVPQDVRLMSGTLRENLTYGLDRDVTEQELRDACRKSRADRFLNKLPQGLDTPVEEFGSNLSGGQRQQLAIARAILRDRECLLLDEFTSNLDPKSEDHVLESLEELRKEKTVIVIAHKMSTVEKADRIVVMERGRVAGIGDHKALMSQCESYQAMVRAQSAAAAF